MITLSEIGAVITMTVGVITLFLTPVGTFKYFIEPRLVERFTLKKYATALWISCSELEHQLDEIKDRLDNGDVATKDALSKIPQNDFRGRADWFVKDGYYTMVTAYKISSFSSWLRIYQQELMFPRYHDSRVFVSELYQRTDTVKIAFATKSVLWYDYFDAIGDKMITEQNGIYRPMTFAAFCDRYQSDECFRMFFEQLHMFLWFTANRYGETESKGAQFSEIKRSLDDMKKLLQTHRLLNGLKISRPATTSGGIGGDKVVSYNSETAENESSQKPNVVSSGT